MQSRPYPTTIAAASLALTDRALLAPELAELLDLGGAVGQAVRAAAWAIGGMADQAAQALADGTWYVERCAAYVKLVAATSYRSALAAWHRLAEAVGWREVSAVEARELGADLRELGQGQRWGRHLVITADQRAELERMARVVLAEGWTAPEPPGLDWDRALATQAPRCWPVARGPGQAGRTTKARCPCGDHGDEDRHPSLVLWASTDRDGGCRCMVTGRLGRWRREQDHLVVAFRDDGSAPADCGGDTPVSTALHTIEPPGATAVVSGPVGGMVSSRQSLGLWGVRGVDRNDEPVHLGHVGGRLEGDLEGSTWLHTTDVLSAGPLRSLAWSERQSAGPRARERALDAAWWGQGLPGAAVLATPLLSVSVLRATAWREIPRRGGGWIERPTSWEPVAQRWVLVDLDDLGLAGADVDQVAEAVARVARRDVELSGRLAVVQTGPAGLQLWAELREVRHTPARWFARPEVRAWYLGLGARCLRAARRAGAAGGLVDGSSCAAGRWGRRPGWRLVEGRPFRARLVIGRSSAVRGRCPRL